MFYTPLFRWPCLGVKIVLNVLIIRLTSHGGLGKHFSDYPTLQELVDKSFQIKKSCWTSSWH
jgi:hypothetical protein